jgi:hypothetical protein
MRGCFVMCPSVPGNAVYRDSLLPGKWWCLTPLSTIFQLYPGGQFYWWRTQRKPPTCRKSRDKLYYIMLYTSSWSRFELTTSVVIGCITYFRHVYMFTLTILRVGNGYLIENRVLPKKSRWLQIKRWILFVICYIGCFCTVFVSLPRIRYLEYFITSSSGEEEDVTVGDCASFFELEKIKPITEDELRLSDGDCLLE